MSAAGDEHEGHDGQGSRRGYLIGFGLSAILTALPFWLVMSGTLASPWATAIAVVLLALVQIAVHTVFFLHVTTRTEGGWTLLAMIFALVVIVIMISGSMWIMYHLGSNMMPGQGLSAAP